MNLSKILICMVFSLTISCNATTFEQYVDMRSKNPAGTATYFSAVVDGFFWAYEADKPGGAGKEDHSFCLPKDFQLNGRNIILMLDKRIEEDIKNPMMKQLTISLPIELTLLHVLRTTFPCSKK